VEVVGVELHTFLTSAPKGGRYLIAEILKEYAAGDYVVEHWIFTGIMLETVVERNACVSSILWSQ
jgi:hypothetical protein